MGPSWPVCSVGRVGGCRRACCSACVVTGRGEPERDRRGETASRAIARGLRRRGMCVEDEVETT